jgi:hypothetical protein
MTERTPSATEFPHSQTKAETSRATQKTIGMRSRPQESSEDTRSVKGIRAMRVFLAAV